MPTRERERENETANCNIIWLFQFRHFALLTEKFIELCNMCSTSENTIESEWISECSNIWVKLLLSQHKYFNSPTRMCSLCAHPFQALNKLNMNLSSAPFFSCYFCACNTQTHRTHLIWFSVSSERERVWIDDTFKASIFFCNIPFVFRAVADSSVYVTATSITIYGIA